MFNYKNKIRKVSENKGSLLKKENYKFFNLFDYQKRCISME